MTLPKLEVFYHWRLVVSGRHLCPCRTAVPNVIRSALKYRLNLMHELLVTEKRGIGLSCVVVRQTHQMTTTTMKRIGSLRPPEGRSPN